MAARQEAHNRMKLAAPTKRRGIMGARYTMFIESGQLEHWRQAGRSLRPWTPYILTCLIVMLLHFPLLASSSLEPDCLLYCYGDLITGSRLRVRKVDLKIECGHSTRPEWQSLCIVRK